MAEQIKDVYEFLGKLVIISDRGIVGRVYMIGIRPKEYGHLLFIMYGKAGDTPPTLEDTYTDEDQNFTDMNISPVRVQIVEE